MTYMRWSDDEDALHEDLAAPSANEQLLRYVGMHERSVNGIGQRYLEDADAMECGTDFP